MVAFVPFLHSTLLTGVPVAEIDLGWAMWMECSVWGEEDATGEEDAIGGGDSIDLGFSL